MNITLTWQAVGVIIAILSHAFATIWWASKTNHSLLSINSNLSRIDKELEKRDDQITALWKRVDELRDLIKD